MVIFQVGPELTAFQELVISTNYTPGSILKALYASPLYHLMYTPRSETCPSIAPIVRGENRGRLNLPMVMQLEVVRIQT